MGWNSEAEVSAVQASGVAHTALAVAHGHGLLGSRCLSSRPLERPGRYAAQSMPSLRIRARRVCGLISSKAAAPNGPSMRPLVAAKARWMCWRMASSSETMGWAAEAPKDRGPSPPGMMLAADPVEERAQEHKLGAVA